MALVKTVRLNIITDPGDSKVKLDLITRKADELGKLNPTLKVQIDTAAANLKLAVMKQELRSIGNGPDTSSSSSSGWSNFQSKLSGIIGSTGTGAAGAGGTGLLGITTTLPLVGTLGVPALAGLAVAAGAALLALTPVAAAIIPITLGFGTLAAFAGPEVVKVFKAMTAQGTALKTGMKNLSPAQRDLLNQLEPLRDQFGALKKAVQPEIMKAFGEAIKIVKDLMPALKPLIKAAAKALDEFLKQITDWLASPSGQSFVNWLRTVGPRDIKNFGRVLWDVAHGVGDALHWIYCVGSWIEKFVTHWYQDWVLVKDIAQLQWDQIKVAALTLVFDILGAFTHIPFIGGAFRQARRDIAIELGRIVDDSRRAINEMQAAWDALHGKKVSIEFTTAFVASHGVHVLPAATNAKGTPGAAPGWSWAGELGPALINLKGGEQIIPSHIARGYAGGAGWNIYDFFDPRVAAAMKRVGAGVNAAENAGAAYVQAHPLSYWKFSRFGGIAGPGGGAPGMNAALAQLMYGNIMGRGDWPAWNYVAMRESGWNQFATNASSGAYGIPQALPFSKMPRAAWPGWAGGSSNPAAQISWMWNYMRGVYGGPQGAAAHEAAFNWYDRGGYLPTGLSLALNTTGRPEPVGGGGNLVINNLYVTNPDGPALVSTLP